MVILIGTFLLKIKLGVKSTLCCYFPNQEKNLTEFSYKQFVASR